MAKEQFERVHLIVLDSVGIGESPDAHLFGDVGADTLGHIAREMTNFHMPNMAKLGLSNIRQIEGVQFQEPLAVSVRCKKLLSVKIQ